MNADPPLVVLIVEDEPLLRMAAQEMVEDAGFCALIAGSAEEAIAILETRSDIGIVFTDIHMPGRMDGLRLAAAVRDRWPPVRIIVTSGLGNPSVDELPEGAVFIAKPYMDRTVIDAMRRMAA